MVKNKLDKESHSSKDLGVDMSEIYPVVHEPGAYELRIGPTVEYSGHDITVDASVKHKTTSDINCQ